MTAISPKLDEDALWMALDEVKDPEIPVVSLVEMGIVRCVVVDGARVRVTMTPTFSGCPALVEMKKLIEEKMVEQGAEVVTVETQLNPPWSSDWITVEGRAKLKGFGLAPPAVHGGHINVTFFDLVACPRCDSTNTSLKNSFGSTLCRAIYYCHDCEEPFEQFKAL